MLLFFLDIELVIYVFVCFLLFLIYWEYGIYFRGENYLGSV